MNSANGGSNELRLKPEYLPILSEGISLVLSRWTALQMAILNEWGGRLSRQKGDLLVSEILSFFTKSKEPLFIDDLENLLMTNTTDSFSMVVDDGSIEEVAEELMILHEELLHGDLKSIEKLRKSRSASEAVSKSKAMVNNDDNDDESSSDDEASDMAVDEPKLRLGSKSETMAMDHKKQETVETEDGWSVVSSKRNKGKRL